MVTLTTVKSGAHSILSRYWFYLLHKFKIFQTFFRNLFPQNSGTIFPQTGIFWNNIPKRSGITEQDSENWSGIWELRNLFHNGNGKISGSFPYVNSVTRNSGGNQLCVPLKFLIYLYPRSLLDIRHKYKIL